MGPTGTRVPENQIINGTVFQAEAATNFCSYWLRGGSHGHVIATFAVWLWVGSLRSIQLSTGGLASSLLGFGLLFVPQ